MVRTFPTLMATLPAMFCLLGNVHVTAEPPAINPFKRPPAVRQDAVKGFVELSDGSVYPGHVYLTRGLRLKVFDLTAKRQREIPFDKISRIDCAASRQWMEREWRFKANADNQKLYTGRRYPAREYIHTITLEGGKTIRGPVSAIVYLQPEKSAEARKLILHKRHKGPVGSDLKSLVYVRSVRLGEKQYQEGRKLAAQQGKAQQGKAQATTKKTAKEKTARPKGLKR